ncbi:MAG: amidohydrolase [Bacteroidota bacterium]
MKITKLLILMLPLIMAACSRPLQKADVIYHNGIILTMEKEGARAEAVAVKDGKILAAGKENDIMKYKGDSTLVIDLESKTMVPGFVDPHSHFIAAVISWLSTNISSPPIDSVRCIKDITDKLIALKKQLNSQPGDILVGMGLDPDQLAEKRYPTIADLDKLFPDNPVVLVHASGHICVANSYALKLAGINENTPDPAGGSIRRINGTKKPDGVLFENAWFDNTTKFAMPTAKKIAEKVIRSRADQKKEGEKITALPTDLDARFGKLVDHAQQMYAECGYTTAQEGASEAGTIGFLKLAAKEKKLYIDVVSLVASDLIDSLAGNPAFTFGTYSDHLVFHGAKFVCDGSPQGKTAYLSQPLLPGSGCQHDCSGKPNISQQDLNRLLKKCYQYKIPAFAHCNGDSAIDMYIAAHENAIKELNLPDTNRGTVIIHSQIIRPDQLHKYKVHHIFPSFFSNHTFYWGDIHIVNLGKERAFFISPMKAALDSGIVFSNHTDYNVTPLNAIFTIWTAVNRVSRTGVVIGPDQRISPYEALKAITISSAAEIGEQKTKGSIEPGKLADFAILSDNPLTVEPMQIKGIRVVETIKEGKSVYKIK